MKNKLIKIFTKNKKVIFTISLATVLILTCKTTYADTSAIDELGENMFEKIVHSARWICLGCSGLEIAKCAAKKEAEVSNVGKIIIKYSALYGSIFVIRWAFEAIESFWSTH